MLYFEKWQRLQACYTEKKNKQNKTNKTKKYIQNYSTQKIQKQPKKNKQENHACGAFEISLRVYSWTRA